MIGIIFGSIWGVLCFVAGCILTFLMCKHFEKAAPQQVPPPRNLVSNNSLLDAVMPKIINRPIHYDDDEDEDDEDDSN